MPLTQTREVPELLAALLKPVWNRQQPLQRIYAPSSKKSGEEAEAREELLALGYEVTRSQQAKVDGQWVAWEERILVVYSPSLAKKARQGLAHRLERAEEELRALTSLRGRGKWQCDDLEILQGAVQSIPKKRRVEGLLDVTYLREVERRPIRKYRDRPACTEERVRYVVQVQRNQEAIAAAGRLLGWRL